MKFLTLLIVLAVCSFGQEKKSFEQSFKEKSKDTERIARIYFQHYLNTEIKKMGNYLNEESTWFDPTAEKVFGGKLLKGKKSIVENLTKTYQNIKGMSVENVREMFSGRFAMFEVIINYSWTPQKGKTRSYSLPAIFIFKIENGKVIEHRDYADYTVWIDQNKKYKN